MQERLLYEGKAKRVYATSDPQQVVVEFKDDATAFNGMKRGQIAGKGEVNAAMSVRLFRLLADHGMATHFRQQLDARRLLTDYLRMVPLEVVVRNRVAGSLQKRTGLPEGTELAEPVVEFYYKNDALGDPLLNGDHIRILQLASPDRVARLRADALGINHVLTGFLADRKLLLVDFKLEFGMVDDVLKLGDEISPDTCRLWDRDSLTKLDKDRFRQDLGDVEGAYQEVLRRVLS
ncbi:MAG: phosphoribosylaminoimidazolesuccinocarboxamide synthase [Thermaerobacter sp.]|nr:phosphoribosylaminoimidazolesuccinocarboxamide synthase [Thermaerobacter sp.]